MANQNVKEGEVVKAPQGFTLPGADTINAVVGFGQSVANTVTGDVVPTSRDIILEGRSAAEAASMRRRKKGIPTKLYQIADAEATKIVERAGIYAAYELMKSDSGFRPFNDARPAVEESIPQSVGDVYKQQSELELISGERLWRELEQQRLDKKNKKGETLRDTIYVEADADPVKDSTKIQLKSPSATRADIWAIDSSGVPYDVRYTSDNVHNSREELVGRLAQPDPVDPSRTRRQVIHDELIATVGESEAQRRIQDEADKILAEYQRDNTSKIKAGNIDRRNSARKSAISTGKTAVAIYGLPFIASQVDASFSAVIDTLANFIEALPGDIANAPIPESWGVPGQAIKLGLAHLREGIVVASVGLGTARFMMKRLTDGLQIKAIAEKNGLLQQLVSEKIANQQAIVHA